VPLPTRRGFLALAAAAPVLLKEKAVEPDILRRIVDVPPDKMRTIKIMVKHHSNPKLNGIYVLRNS
jgi:hypothetical protein